jgi:hypothetical protein
MLFQILVGEILCDENTWKAFSRRGLANIVFVYVIFITQLSTNWTIYLSKIE